MSNVSLFHRTNKLTISVRQPMHRPFLWNNRGPVNDLSDLRPRQHNVKPVAILRFITTLVCYSAHARTKAAAGSCEQEWGVAFKPQRTVFRLPIRARKLSIFSKYELSSTSLCRISTVATGVALHSSCISSNALSAPERSWVQKTRHE